MISIVTPCYNEEESLPLFIGRTEGVMNGTGEDYEIIFVDDGSRDNTLNVLKRFAEEDRHIKVIELSRNFGKEAALTAGLDNSSGDAVVTMDSDLQHPPELIPAMLEKWREGYDVVAARRDRRTDSRMKKFTAEIFYRVHNSLSRIKVPANVGDFRLMSRSVVDALGMMNETQRFMKGLFAWAGFRTLMIDYDVAERAAGSSKFSLFSLWHFAVEGITSFSTLPLTIWCYVGGITAIGAFLYGLDIAAETWIFGVEVPGFATLVCLILFFGGLQLLGIGIMGEYLGRTYMESKRRPVYIIRKIYQKGGGYYMLSLIVNADDFGSHELVNSAVVKALAEGALRSASVMAGGDAFDDAVRIAGLHENLGVGLHLTLVMGNPVLPPYEIPSLVNEDGRFYENFSVFVKRYLTGRIDLDEVRSELSAQLRKAQSAGLKLTHIDSHQHLHVLPGVLNTALELAQSAGISAVRMPELPGLSLSPSRMGLKLLAHRGKSRAESMGFRIPENFAGIVAGEAVNAQWLCRYLEDMPEGASELMIHPGTDNGILQKATGWEHDFEEELDAVTSPEVMRIIEQRKIALVNYDGMP